MNKPCMGDRAGAGAFPVGEGLLTREWEGT